MNILVIDTEHSFGPLRPYDDGFYLSCIGVLRSDGVKEVLWNDHAQEKETPDWVDRIRGHIKWADRVVCHNLKHDMTILRNYAISFEEVKLWCTMVAEYTLSGQDTRRRTYGLDAVAKYYGIQGKIDKVQAMWKSGIDTYNIPSNILHDYVLQDCQTTYDIFLRQQEIMEPMRLILELHMEYTKALSDMEFYGFKFDVNLAKSLIADYEKDIAMYRQQLIELSGFADLNPASNQQISALLFGGSFKVDGEEWVTRTLKHETKYYPRQAKVDYHMPGLGFTPPTKKRNKDGSWPVGKGIIKKLRGKTPKQKIALQVLTEYAHVKKAKETLEGKDGKGLINKVRLDGNIHPNFNQCVATTGRLTSSDPNGQNLPRGSTSPLKRCIIPKYDYILQVDLSQIEWRVAAWLSQDPVMINEINGGVDQHSKACLDLMELPLTKDNRTYAKIFNFRMIFGGSAYGFFMDNKMPNFPLRKWRQIVQDFQNKYSGLASWWATAAHDTMMGQGTYTIPTGRQFKFILDADKGEYPERKVKNYPVQGMAGADILPILCVQIRRGLKRLGLLSRLILTVHDSLVLDLRSREKAAVIKLITGCVASLSRSISKYYNINWNVDLAAEIEIGNNYGELGDTIVC